jgi:hypothetical protein
MASESMLPEAIRAAGDEAACAYRKFLDDSSRSTGTRRKYQVALNRFFHWAEEKGLTLATVDGSAFAAYAAETKLPPNASHFPGPIRGLFQHLHDAGVLAGNPKDIWRPGGKLRASVMSGQEFARIGARLFGEGPEWKHPVARALDRRWNTVWCYESGRRPIPAKVAEEVRAWDRAMDEAIAALAAETPEEKRQRFLRFITGPKIPRTQHGQVTGHG